MTASATAHGARPSLWDQAFDSLDISLRSSLRSTKTHKRDILEAVLTEIEVQRNLAIRNRWKFKKPNGDIVVVRDVLEKIARWIYRFKEMGDIIAQYDPAHLSLPWAAFRFLLQISVSKVQAFGAMTDDLEIIARIITRYREFERLYLQGTKFDLESMLEQALIRLYAEILTHLACAVRFFREKSIVHWIMSPFRTVDEKRMHQVIAQEAEVLKIAQLTDTDKILNLEAAVIRLSVQANMYSQSLSEDRYSRFLEWLSVLPYHNYHQFVSQSRLTHVGKWLLNNRDYVDWQTSSSSSILLVHGITGSGKSMLCSMIVDSLLFAAKNDPSAAPFGYIYCANPDFEKPRRSSAAVMRSVLGQLALDRTGGRTIKEFLYSEYERQVATASVDGLDLPKLNTQDCIRLVLELAEQDPLTIIIDAIDTVEESERYTLASALEEIALKADNVVKILMTSRSSNRAALEPKVDMQIQITSHETQRDMESFVNHLIDTAVNNKMLLEGRVSPALRIMLIEALLDGAGEMFLWAKLQIERLCRVKVEDDVMIALENNLPEDLDQLYQESLSHILKSGMTARDIAVRIFSWILHMREPLTPSALLAAISNGQKSTIHLKDLMALCENLVVLDQPCNVMRFAHQSVKDFLERHDAFTGAVAHNILASTCIEVCSRGPISSRSLQNPGDDFYVYAAMYWPIHSNMAESMASNKDVVNTLTSFIFDEDFNTTLSFASWLERRGEIVSVLANDHDMKVVLDAIPDGDTGPLFLISVFGLTNLLRVVFEHVVGLNVNEKNKHGHTPTYLAAAFGHSASLSMLIDHGADVNSQCGKYGSPLHAACFAGQLEVVKTLLKFDAKISCGDVFDDAFQAACRGGREGVALFLIDSDLVRSEDDYDKVLEGAACAGFIDVVEKLHEPQFLHFNNSKPDKVKKKTKKAIQGGQLGVIRQFLDQQAERRDVLPLDAVALATLYNHKSLVEFLLDEGMSVEAEGAFGTPLRTACLLNYQPIARLLLHRGAEIDACGTFGDALQAAAMKGHTMVVRYIIEEGANVNQQNGFYVELLLDAGANVHAKGYSKDAFYAAAEGGHQDVITLMLRKGYKFYRPLPPLLASNASPSPYKALMRDASPGRDPGPYRQKQSFPASKIISTKEAKPIVELEAIFGPAEQGSKIAREYPQETPAAGYRPQGHVRKNFPLEAAASAGHEECVKVLLKNCEVLGISENEISHAIILATSNDYWSVVQLLLDDVAKRHSVKPYINSILEVVRQRQQSPIVGFALAQASKYCSADEIVEIKQHLVAAVHEKPYDPEANQETLILDFEKSCKSGDIQVINAILASEHHKLLSPREIDAGLQLCVLNGHATVVQLLCESPLLKVRLPLSGEEAFVVAAGNGSVDLMKLLTSYWPAELTISNSVAVIRALVVASGNGHIDVVRYLVQDISADINTPADDKPVGLGLNKSDWATSPLRITPNDFKSQSPAREEEPTVVPVIFPLQAALRSFSRFKPTRDPYSQMSLWSKNEPRKAGRSQYEEVIVFLLSYGSKLSDLGDRNVNLIQMAVEFCPTYIAEKFVSAVTDVSATLDGNGALFAAAGRELSSATIVRRLLAKGATIPEKVEEQEKLLNQALRYFEGDTRREYFHDTTRDPDGRFLEASSLEYVFNEGSGAVLYDLLRLMPRITATDVQWNLVLQMAALLNNQLFLDLLLSRGADVNAPGYYYGTALEAAARCGHTGMVHKLLDAGAKVNVISGRWQTALRAAIIGCHEAIVETLLNHGADMELRLPRQRLYMNDKEKASNNALQLGVQTGNLSIVKTLLRHGANAAHDEAETLHPLILASKQGNLEMVKVLLDAGAPLNVHGKKPNPHMLIEAENASPMHAAIARGHLDVLELLLSQGADIENDVEHARTPLCVAASKCRADVVRFLLSAGASATDGVALYGAVREKSIEIAKELLAAGSTAEPVLAFACRQGFLPMIELLLEEVYGGENSETVIDEVFAIAELDGSVFRLLLDYAQPTMRRFVRICAACSVELVEIMLDKKSIDVNGQAETDGDYPLQVAALHLRAEVAQLFLVSGADVNCKSAKHGTPLMTALEACAASMLWSIKSERGNGFVDQLNLPKPRWFYAHNLSKFQQISDCEHIAQLLINHGANIFDDSRPFGSPMHLACLLGSEGLVELLLEKGADLSTTAGYFEKTIFAAIHGDHPGIVELLLQKAPLTRHIHPEFATPLHLACANGRSAIVRKLLEHGADATVLDTKGWTPLTIALENKRQSGISLDRSYTKAPLEVILELANPLRVLNNDILIANKLGYKDAEKTITLLLDVDKDLIVSEATICHVLNQHYPTVHNQIIQLLMQRNGGIGVTAEMLTAVRTHYNLQELLKHRPLPRITREILLTQKEPRCMKLLVEIDTESPVTEEIIFRALEIGTVTDRRHTSREQLGREVLDILLDQNPDIAVSDEMLQAARCAADMEILLNHLNPGARVSTDVVAAVPKLKQQGEAYRMMRLLLEFDPSIKLDPNMVLQMMILPDAIDTLDMLLERDPSMPVTEEIFLRVFEPSSSRDSWTRTRLADLMDKYGKRLVFTDRLREVIDRAYQSKDQVARKQRFYSLRLTEEDDLGLVDEGEDEKTRSA